MFKLPLLIAVRKKKSTLEMFVVQIALQGC